MIGSFAGTVEGFVDDSITGSVGYAGLSVTTPIGKVGPTKVVITMKINQ